MKKFRIAHWLTLSMSALLVLSQALDYQAVKADQKDKTSVQLLSEADETEIGTLRFTGNYQLRLGKKDKYGRATAAHIQLQARNMPHKKRETKITYSPIGWHNYKFYYGKGGEKTWLMSRGHLIGYQFSGLSDEGKNLVPITAWLDSGASKGSDRNNQDSMFYYEQRLQNWLTDHPGHWLDYKVTPIYVEDELLPRQIELQYVGFDADGNIVSIELGGREMLDQDGMTHVLLDNLSPNAEINYKTGTASNTMDENTKTD
ncbi:DNA/RNA non-specific endonuclease [Streptococcus panodentis]|uniref:Deoxyribonuclease n=1 Tax=Streptococcus panodentis TaxID=1581472 RepID=A0ABS5ATG5_9STRE|nr:DNA/RNA non-specific endonuclease [Streptococcus panodentis]MBP2619761.1 deoxyribonuclease [Streptococcus panodentis]